MRVLYFCQYFVTPSMIGSTRAYEFARRLVADGHSVHVITSDQQRGAKRTELIDGIEVTWIPVRYSNKMGYFRRVYAFLLFALLASIEGVRAKPTIVFATSTPLTIMIPALMAKWIRRVPMVFEVRDLWPEMPIAVGALTNPLLIRFASWMEKLAYFQSRKVIALSPGMRDGVITTGYPAKQVVMIPNSSDIDRFQVDPVVGKEWLAAQRWSRGGPMVLYAGTLGEVNAVDSLVDIAVESVDKFPDIDFLVAGSGKMFEAIQKKARVAGVLGKNFHMIGSLPKNDMPKVYSAATVALSLFAPIPEMEKNSANKFFDGLASGTPMAINYGGWHQHLLEDNQCGIRISRNATEAIRQLGAYVQHVRDSGEASCNALQLAREQFDRDKLYIDFRDVLTSCENDHIVSDPM